MISSLRSRLSAVAVLLPATAGSAWAHAGDHSGGLLSTLHHMFASADHLSLLLAAAGAAVVLGFGLRALRRQR